MLYLWLKAFHIITVITWFAGIFYLPRLFVYHAMAEDTISRERFKVMERKLYRGIMTPSMVLAVGFGVAMLLTEAGRGWLTMGWLHVKLALVAAVLVYHFWCGRLVKVFRHDANTRSHRWYRVFNEVPVLALVAIVLLVVLKPF